MQVKDVMTQNVISIQSSEPVSKAARLMLLNWISGLPVVDNKGELVGIVTEGDLIRRSEIGTQRRRPKWLKFIVGPGRLANEYVHTSGRKIDEIMTPEPCVVAEDDPLEEVVELMERRHIKRLPVMRGRQMVGIVSRSNLVRALAARTCDAQPTADDGAAIRDNILAAFAKLSWAPRVTVVVNNGTAELRGVITDERERQGLIVATENVPGVKKVHDHLVWVEPMSAMAFPSAEDEAQERAKAS